MPTEPQSRHRSTKWRLAITFAIVFASFIVALIPIAALFAVIGLIVAGFVYAATANGNSIERSIFTSGGATAASLALAIVTAFTLLSVDVLWLDWLESFSADSLSIAASVLLLSPITGLILFVFAAVVLGGIGGAMAEVARDGVVCRAIAKARG